MAFRYNIYFLLILYFTSILYGCTSIRDNHSGNNIRDIHGSLIPIEPGQGITHVHGLRLDYEISRNYINILKLEGANRCFPATVYSIEILLNRIIGQINSGLYIDAANDIIIIRKHLTKLSNSLEMINDKTNCHHSKNNLSPLILKNMSLLHKAKELLNSDNQFAFNSYKLSAKYKRRILDAIEILKKFKGISIVITGHTDSIGSSSFNKDLSYFRAQQVSNFISLQGMKSVQLKLIASGEDNPIVNSMSPEDRLINRRVEISIVGLPKEVSLYD